MNRKRIRYYLSQTQVHVTRKVSNWRLLQKGLVYSRLERVKVQFVRKYSVIPEEPAKAAGQNLRLDGLDRMEWWHFSFGILAHAQCPMPNEKWRRTAPRECATPERGQAVRQAVPAQIRHVGWATALLSRSLRPTLRALWLPTDNKRRKAVRRTRILNRGWPSSN